MDAVILNKWEAGADPSFLHAIGDRDYIPLGAAASRAITRWAACCGRHCRPRNSRSAETGRSIRNCPSQDFLQFPGEATC